MVLVRTFWTVLLCLCIEVTFAQNSVSFQVALNHYQENEGVNISFDPDLVDQVVTDLPYSNLSFNEFVEAVSQNYPLEIKSVGEKYFAITTTESEYSISLSDSIDSSLITAEIFDVSVNGKSIPAKSTGSELTFSYRPEKNQTLTVFVLGYQREDLTWAQLLNGKRIDLSLTPSTVKLPGLTIEDYLTTGINLNPSSQSIQIDVSDLPLLPGETDGDIFASLAALPGVNSPDSRAGNLLIRNSPTDQSLILFEGIPIYHRGHYFGTISPYNPKVIDEVKVFRSGFHPRLGGRVGGAIEVNASDQPVDQSTYGLGANSFYGMAYSKIPIDKESLSVSFGLRHSYPGDYLPPKLEAISKSIFDGTALIDTTGNFQSDIGTTFRDAQMKLAWRANSSNVFTISGIYTRSVAEYDLVGGVLGEVGQVENSFTNLGADLGWRSQLNEKWQSSSSVTFSEYDFEFLTNEAIENQDVDIDGEFSTNTIFDLSARQEFGVAVGLEADLQFGVSYNWQEVQDSYRSPVPINPDLIVIDGRSNSSHLVSPYVNVELNTFKNLYLQLGLRANYYSRMSDFKLAPRIFANYYVGDRLTLKASAGKYYQYLSQVKNLEFTGGGFDNELWILATDDLNNIIDGTQFMAGFLYELNSWILDIEGYHKRADDVTYYPVPRLDPTSEFFLSDHKIKGIDFLLKKEVSPSLSVWAGYTLSESKLAIDTATTIYYNDRYSQPNIFKLGGAFAKGRWKASLGWRISSGLNARPINVLEVLNTIGRRPPGPPPPGPTPGPPPPPRDLESEIPLRFDPVHSLDLSVSFKIPETETRPWSASFGLSLINAYDQNNLTDQVVRGFPPEFLDRQAITFAPNLMLLVEW